MQLHVQYIPQPPIRVSTNINHDIEYIPITPISIFHNLFELNEMDELPTLFHVLRGFNPSDPPGTIRSDAENVHDGEVNQLIKESIDILTDIYQDLINL
jgi:hypothetical protein